MTLEVELKYRVQDTTKLDQRIAELGARESSVDSQFDHYFNHPCRDFAVTDEAFRIRVQQAEAFLTYKGPRLDTQTKTRREIEVGLAHQEGSVELTTDMLLNLGFRPVATVAKQRTTFLLPWRDQQVTLTRDQVQGLGLFVEIELVVQDSELETAKACLLELAAELKLEDPIHTSYLELLLKQST